MWLSLFENGEIVKSIYGDQIPSLDNIYLHEVKIVNGEELQCYLRFDLNILPQSRPLKWARKAVNTVQLDVILLGAEIISFSTSGGDMIGELQITSIGNFKKVSFVVNGTDIFVFQAKWLDVRNITGYINGNKAF
jgi:hypothetical protein